MPLPETPSSPGKSFEIESSTTENVVSFQSGVDMIVSWTTLDLPVGTFIPGVVDTIWDEDVLLRSTTLDLLVVFFKAAVVDSNWNDNVLLFEAEYVELVRTLNVILWRVENVLFILLEDVVPSDSVWEVFEGAWIDVFVTSRQSAGRRSLHLRINLSTTPFCLILAATQK